MDDEENLQDLEDTLYDMGILEEGNFIHQQFILFLTKSLNSSF